LEQALEEIRKLPAPAQDEAAELLFDLMARRAGPVKLDHATRDTVRKGLDDVRKRDIATDERVAAVFDRFR
jgi:hypothetical protein